MTNWILTINRPEYLEKSELLVPKHNLSELLAEILENKEWAISASITIKPTEMEYFDGRP